MQISVPPGLLTDRASARGEIYWETGENVRFLDNGDIATTGVDTTAPDVTDPTKATEAAIMSGPTAPRYRTAMSMTLAGLADERALMIFGASNAVTTVQQEAFGDGTPGWRVRDKTPTTSFTAPTDAALLSTAPFYGVDVAPRWNFASAANAVFGVISSGVTGVGAGVSNPLFSWDLGAGTTFTPVANSPSGAAALALTDDQIVLLMGAEVSAGTGSPLMNLRWADRGDPTLWTPASTNVAGEQLLRAGSKIVGGGRTGRGIVCWTDAAMYLISELRDIDAIFRPDEQEIGGGLIANGAWTEAAGLVYYLGADRSVRVWDGGGAPRKIPCPVKSYTFDRCPAALSGLICAWTDPAHQEVGWAIPDTGGYGDAEVHAVFNYALNRWSFRTVSGMAITTSLGSLHAAYVDSVSGNLRFHDIDWAHPDVAAAGQLEGPYEGHAVVPRSWRFSTNRWLMAADEQDGGHATARVTRGIVSSLAAYDPSGSPDPFKVTFRTWQDIELGSHDDEFTLSNSGGLIEPRMNGRATQVIIASDGADSTVRTFGPIPSSIEMDGYRR